MVEKLGSVILGLMRKRGLEDPAFSFEPEKGSIAKALNSAFLIVLAGAAHPAFERARVYLESMSKSAAWEDVAKFSI